MVETQQITLNAMRQNLQTSQDEVSAAQQQAQAQQAALQTQQALRSSGLQGMQQRQVTEQNIGLINKYADEVAQQSQQFETYLKTPSGIKQSSIEAGNVATSTKDIGVGSKNESGYLYQEYPETTTTYTSPFGYGTTSETSGGVPQKQTIAIDNSSVKYNTPKENITTTIVEKPLRTPVNVGEFTTTGYTIETPQGGMSYQYINPLQPIKFQTFEPVKGNFIERLSKNSEGYSLLGNNFASVQGLFKTVAEEARKYVAPPEQQKILFSDVTPYKLRGTASGMEGYNVNGTPKTEIIPSQFFTPEEVKTIQQQKTAQQQVATTDTVYTAPYIVATLLGGPAATTGSALYFTGSAEQLFTPTGSAEIKKSVSEGANPYLSYGLPVAGMVLGAIGVRQSYLQTQKEALQKASLSLSQPTSETYKVGGWKSDKEYQDFFSKQVSTSKLSEPGVPHIIYNDNLPTLRTISNVEMIPTGTGGFTYSGQGKTAMKVFDIFKGDYVDTISKAYPVGGVIEPGQIGRFQGKNYPISVVSKSFAGAEPNKIYAGEYNPETNTFSNINYGPNSKIIRQQSGGILTSELGKGYSTRETGFSLGESKIDENLRTISGPSTPKSGYPNTIIIQPKNLGYTFPEIDVTPKKSFLASDFGKRGQVSLVPEIFRNIPGTNIPEFVPVISGNNNNIMSRFIADNIGGVGKFFVPNYFQVPLVNIRGLQTTTTTPTSIQTQTPLQGQVIIQSTIQTPATIQTPMQIQVPIQTPVQTIVPIQTPVQKIVPIQTTIQKQVPVTIPTLSLIQTPINPNIGIFSFPSIENKGTSKSISKRKAYNVLIKRKGKFFEIAKGLPEGKALKVGVEKALTTLARTFQLQPSGETEQLDISYFPSSQLFRPPKRATGNPLTFVQRQALNRGSGEVPEIIRAKRAAPKKNIFKTKKTRRFKLFK